MATDADKLIAAWTEARDRIKLITDKDLAAFTDAKASSASNTLLNLYAPAAAAARDAAAFVKATADAAASEYSITSSIAGAAVRNIFAPSIEASTNAVNWFASPGATYLMAGVNVATLPVTARIGAYRDELVSHCNQILDSLRVPKAHLDSLYHTVAAWILQAVSTVIAFVKAVVAAVGAIIGAVVEVVRAIGTSAGILGTMVRAVPWLAAGAVVFLGGRWAYRRGKRVWRGGPLFTRKKTGGVAGVFAPAVDQATVDRLVKRIEDTAKREQVSLRAAAYTVARRDPAAAGAVLDKIGLWPASDPALRALQQEASSAFPMR